MTSITIAVRLTDWRLAKLLSVVPKGQITVIEDVDRVFPARTVSKYEKENPCPVTLGGFLNAIEGNVKDCEEGRLIFIVVSTTQLSRLSG